MPANTCSSTFVGSRLTSRLLLARTPLVGVLTPASITDAVSRPMARYRSSRANSRVGFSTRGVAPLINSSFKICLVCVIGIVASPLWSGKVNVLTSVAPRGMPHRSVEVALLVTAKRRAISSTVTSRRPARKVSSRPSASFHRLAS